MSLRLASRKISTNIGAIAADDLIDSDDEMGNNLTLLNDSGGHDDEGLDDEDVYGEDRRQSDEDDENSNMDGDLGNEADNLGDDNAPRSANIEVFPWFFRFFIFLTCLQQRVLRKSIEVEDDDDVAKKRRRRERV
ncbi:hypothetical protein B0H14DRAFT_2648659 [Mycena olivaceomarginata]|nr:hypothetical protein B0H14DRAFT_2648659 [Mycena olivaceomarginata]